MSPLVAAITAAISQIVAFIVGFGVINNTQAGLAISLATGLVNLGVLAYSAIHNHSKAIVAVAGINAAAAAIPASATAAVINPTAAPAPTPAAPPNV